MKYEEKINKAILTLDVLIDCTKEDGTSYTARKEWEALATFKQLQNNWNELKKWVNRYYDYYMNNEDFIGGRLCFTDIKNKMQELEDKSE